MRGSPRLGPPGQNRARPGRAAGSRRAGSSPDPFPWNTSRALATAAPGNRAAGGRPPEAEDEAGRGAGGRCGGRRRGSLGPSPLTGSPPQALVDDTEDVSLDFGSEEELALQKAKIR